MQNMSRTHAATCGLYYKHVTLVNDASSDVIKWSFKLIDAARGIIYDRHMFIVQDTAAETGSWTILIPFLFIFLVLPSVGLKLFFAKVLCSILY